MAALAAAWLALLVAAPVLHPSLAALTYAAGSLICHQLPARSFHLDAFQLPVCARCLGIYAGAAAGCLVAVVSARRLPGRPATQLTRDRWFTALALAPTLVTVVLEWAGVWYPSNVTRALAGAPAGYAVALVVTRALATVHYGEWAPRRPAARNPPRSHI